MSVHDVAAVDRVSSLRRTPAPQSRGPSSGSSLRVTSSITPLPTSPSRGHRPDSDTLRRAMARHQASLSRPESPKTLNDDLPIQSRNVMKRGSSGAGDYQSPVVMRHRERDNRYRLVSSTGYRTATTAGDNRSTRATPSLEETKASLRNSQVFLDEINFESKTLPKMENIYDSNSHERSHELHPKQESNPHVPYSTFSLPRNHRLINKSSTKRFESSLRESQERLLSSSREFLIPESRETLLSRYPSHHQQQPRPRVLHPDDDIPPPHPYPDSQHHPAQGFRLQPSRSSSHVPPPEYQYYHEPTPYSNSHYHSRGYQSDHYEGYHSDFDYRSCPVSPALSARSSRAASPSNSFRSDSRAQHRPASPARSIHSRGSYSRRDSPASSRRSSRASSPHDRPRRSDYFETQEYIRCASIRLNDITSPNESRRSSRASSTRSSRAASPAFPRNDNLDHILMAARNQAEANSKIVYVRETFQVIPSSEPQPQTPLKTLPALNSHNLVKINTEERQLTMSPPFPTSSSRMFSPKKKSPEERIKVVDDGKSDVSERSSISKVDVGMMTDNEDDCDGSSVISTSSLKMDKGVFGDLSKADDKEMFGDLSKAGISNIEQMLESLSRRVRNVETKENVDNDDSARAESVASIHSSTSSTRGDRRQEKGAGGQGEQEAHSMIRRQSVIIEGLTLETDELKRRCQMLEDEIVSGAADELHHKLEQMEGKLEETENYCYQVVEENVELKTEIENLESEISEVQDTFRDKDAKEFKKTKWELENLAKTCRNLQLKLGKAQAKASRLRQEKEEMEEQQREQTLWKTTAVCAAAALAVLHLVNKYK